MKLDLRQIIGYAKGYHVLSSRPFGKSAVEILFLKESQPDWLCASIELGKITWLPFKEGDEITPTITLHFQDIALLEAMAEGFRDSGIVTTDENMLKGMLDERGRYLQDLRHILKLPKA